MFLGDRKESEGTSLRCDGRNQLGDLGERGPGYGQRGSSFQGPNRGGPFGAQEGGRDFFSNSQVADRGGGGYFKSPQKGGGGPQTDQPRMSLGHQREDNYNSGGRDSFMERGATSSSMGLRVGRGSYSQGPRKSESHYMDSLRSQDFSRDRGSGLTSERESTFAGSGFQHGNGPSREDRSRGLSASYMGQPRRLSAALLDPRGEDIGSILGRGDYSLSLSQDRLSASSLWERQRGGVSDLFMDQRRGSGGSFGGLQRGDNSPYVGQQRQGSSNRGGNPDYSAPQRGDDTPYMNRFGGSNALSMDRDKGGSNQYRDSAYMNQPRGDNSNYDQRGDINSNFDRGGNNSNYDRGENAPSIGRQRGVIPPYSDCQGRNSPPYLDRQGGGNPSYSDRQGGGNSSYSDRQEGGNSSYSDRQGRGNSLYSDRQGGGNSSYSDRQGRGNSPYSDRQGGGNFSYSRRQGGGNCPYPDRQGEGNDSYLNRRDGGGNAPYMDQQRNDGPYMDSRRGDNVSSMGRENSTQPMSRQNNALPMSRQNNDPPLSQQNNAPPMNRQNNAPPMNRQNNAPPMNRQNNAPPMNRQNNAPPISRQNNAPSMSQRNNAPSMNRQNNSPFMSQRNNAPSVNRQNNSPSMSRQNSVPSLNRQQRQSNVPSAYQERGGDMPYANTQRSQGKPGFSDDLVSKRPGMGRDDAEFGGRAKDGLPPQQNRNIQNNPPSYNGTRGGFGGGSNPPQVQNSRMPNSWPFGGSWDSNMWNMNQQGQFNNLNQGTFPGMLSKKRPMDFSSGLPDNKKPRTSVMLRLGAKTGPPETPEGNLPVKKPVQGSDAFEMKRLSPNEIKALAEKNKDFPIKGLYCHICDHHKFSSVSDFFTHWNTIKHMDRRRSMLLKINAAYKYLLSNAQYTFGVKMGKFDPDNNQEVLCAVCEVPKERGMKLPDHKAISECWVLHQYVTPRGCCSTRQFTSRLLYENHKLSLEHLKREHTFRKKSEERYKVEEEKLNKYKELFKKGSTDVDEDGKKICTRYQHSIIGKEVRLYQNLGEHAAPKEVLNLLKALDTKPILPFTRKVENPKGFQMQYFEPSSMHGGNCVIFETNFECILCGVRLERSKQSIIDHCSTKLHYDNILKKQARVNKVGGLGGGGALKKEEVKKEEAAKKGVTTVKLQRKVAAPKPIARRSKWSRGEDDEEDEDDDCKDDRLSQKKANVKSDEAWEKEEVGGDDDEEYDALDCEIDEYEFEPDFEV